MEIKHILYDQHPIADRLVSIQPMVGPTGLAYYLRYRHAEPTTLADKLYALTLFNSPPYLFLIDPRPQWLTDLFHMKG